VFLYFFRFQHSPTGLWQLTDYYNHERYRELLDNLTPADVYFGRIEEVKGKREEIKQKTMKQRRQLNRQMAPNTLSLEW